MNGNRIGVISLLGVVFVAFKLAGVIAWSWWWVTLPFWGVPALCLLLAGAVCAVVGLAHVLTAKAKGGTK